MNQTNGAISRRDLILASKAVYDETRTKTDARLRDMESELFTRLEKLLAGLVSAGIRHETEQLEKKLGTLVDRAIRAAIRDLPAPQITNRIEVKPTPVTNKIDVRPTPVEIKNDVHVAPSECKPTIIVPEQKRMRRKLEKDREGNVTGSVEEPM